jgi:hypothetical protein
VKYAIYGSVGLCLGVALGVALEHLYTLHLYNLATEKSQENGWWGLANFDNELSGGAGGALIGLIMGLLLTWRRQRIILEQPQVTETGLPPDNTVWPPPPSPPAG